jgi:hypothetical protein
MKTIRTIKIVLNADPKAIAFGKFHYPNVHVDKTLFSTPKEVFDYAYKTYGRQLFMVSGEYDDYTYFEYESRGNGAYSVYEKQSTIG